MVRRSFSRRSYATMAKSATKDAAQRRGLTFYEAVNSGWTPVTKIQEKNTGTCMASPGLTKKRRGGRKC